MKQVTSKGVFLHIPIDVYAEVMGYVLASDIEVSGMGQIKFIDGVPTVTRVHIVKQTCTGVETELDADALAELEYECEDGIYAKDGELMWWWHSHVDMGVFWSGTDMEAMRQLSKHGSIIATVFNKKWQLRTAYMQAEHTDLLLPSVFSDELQTRIVPTDSHKDTVKELVQKPKVTHNLYTGGYDWRTNSWKDTWADQFEPKKPATKNKQYPNGSSITFPSGAIVENEKLVGMSLAHDAIVNDHLTIVIDDVLSELNIAENEREIVEEFYDDFEQAKGYPPIDAHELIAYMLENDLVEDVEEDKDE